MTKRELKRKLQLVFAAALTSDNDDLTLAEINEVEALVGRVVAQIDRKALARLAKQT